MREGLIICPQHDNAGQSLQRVKQTAVKSLAKQFGGCTVTCGKGAWVNGVGETQLEPVWQLVVAYDPTAENDAKLKSVARYIGAEGRQEAVYLRLASGDVEILDTQPAHSLHKLAA